MAKKMTAEHKAALGEGRKHSRAVRSYLEALEANKPKRGRKRTPASIQARLDTIEETIEQASVCWIACRWRRIGSTSKRSLPG